jgi:nucleotide-binding universal stress UspA family protein
LALRWAVALAARNQARLTVLTAVDALLAEAARSRLGIDLVSTDAEPALRDFVQKTVPTDGASASGIEIDVQVGEPAAVILAAAERTAADLIAMGTHGIGGFQRLLLGSTAERVLRDTTRPVLTVPDTKSSPVVLAQGSPDLDLKQILVGTDFSAASASALQWGIDIAQHAHAQLVLCHVVQRSAMPAEWMSRVSEVDEERIRDARSRLEAFAAHVGDTVAYDTIVVSGRPAESIAATAEERGAKLIVLGLFSRADSRAPRPGSIAYRVVCVAKVPVLVVPPGTPG